MEAKPTVEELGSTSAVEVCLCSWGIEGFRIPKKVNVYIPIIYAKHEGEVKSCHEDQKFKFCHLAQALEAYFIEPMTPK